MAVRSHVAPILAPDAPTSAENPLTPEHMSMKFFSGLQDLLGLYDSAGTTSPQSPSSPIPPSNGIFNNTLPRPGVRRSPSDINSQPVDDEGPIQKCSHDRSVRFDDDVVTGYSEAPCPFLELSGGEPGEHKPNPEEILKCYREACERNKIAPSPAVEKQIGYMHRSPAVRQESLSLKGERVSPQQMEALEEIFKRVQFDTLDFEYTFLNDECLIALSEMLEFYDSTERLNLSFNRDISSYGWTMFFRCLRYCTSLRVLNLRYTTVERALTQMCKSFKANPPLSITCLHLENISVSSKSLQTLIRALKNNTTLKELYLGENMLQPTDALHLLELIECNTTLQMLDLRNNELGDVGLQHLCKAFSSEAACTRSSLSTLVLWNNRITAASMSNLASVLKENHNIETVNIGNNLLGVEGIHRLKAALSSTSNLHRLGLQNTKLDCEAAIVLAECLADNDAMVRVDLRDNPEIGSAGLLALHSAMKMNTSITLMNLDQSCALPSSEKDEFQRYYDEIRQFCERNKKADLSRISVKLRDDTNEDIITANKASVVEESPSDPVHPTCGVETASQSEGVKLTKRIVRSSSLTCTETVSDINERLREMSGSTHSLDETTNLASVTTIKKQPSTIQPEPLSKVEWGSLPSIPQAVSSTPPVRKLRRFSVSPSSSTFDVSVNSKLTPRPSSLEIGIPSLPSSERSGPSSAPVCMSLPDSLNLWTKSSDRVTSKIHEPIPEVASAKERKAMQMSCSDSAGYEACEADVKTVVTDLVNYVVYEETSAVERKASLLLGIAPVILSLNEPGYTSEASTPLTPSTPSRSFCILEDEMSDEMIVSSVVRGLVRDVLRQEKECLRNTLDRRRRLLEFQSLNSPNV
ncbi:unnamed protein product [Auanema sp. JU1783]|nr:unnamed protein product [Auanema sp. JU1783]